MRWLHLLCLGAGALIMWGGCADETPPETESVVYVSPTHQLCEPRQWTCISDREEGLCGYDGTYWQATEICAVDHTCSPEVNNRCFKPICTPGETRCGDNTMIQVCSDLGDRWNDDFDCDSNYVCLDGRCTLASCLSHVLFVIDRSGSMTKHWTSVRNATASVVATNPVARFGLLGFPAHDGDPCSSTDELHVGLSTDNLEAKIDAFFASPPKGGTPLVFTLEKLRSKAPQVFGTQGGALVVLTDGNDTCAPAHQAHPSYLAQLARDIDQLHNVKTYVIGYDFGGAESEQLEALAANGGTTYTDFIPAGTEEELASVFTNIVKDWKLCF